MTPSAVATAQAILPLGALLLFLLCALAVYAGRCATVGAAEPPDVPGRAPSLVPRWIAGWWLWLWSPVTRSCVRFGIPANAVTLAGGAVALFAAVSLASEDLATGGWLFLLASTLGAIDGRVARATASASRAGAFLDEVTSHVSELLVLGGLAWALRGAPEAAVAALAVAGSAAVSRHAEARADALGGTRSARGGLIQRGERAILIGVPCVLAPTVDALYRKGAGASLVAASLGLLAALTLLGALRRLHGAHAALRTLDAIADRPAEPVRRLRLVRGGRN